MGSQATDEKNKYRLGWPEAIKILHHSLYAGGLLLTAVVYNGSAKNGYSVNDLSIMTLTIFNLSGLFYNISRQGIIKRLEKITMFVNIVFLLAPQIAVILYYYVRNVLAASELTELTPAKDTNVLYTLAIVAIIHAIWRIIRVAIIVCVGEDATVAYRGDDGADGADGGDGGGQEAELTSVDLDTSFV